MKFLNNLNLLFTKVSIYHGILIKKFYIMKTILLFIIFIFFKTGLLISQKTFVGNYNPKSSGKFQLICGNDTVDIAAGKNEIQIFNLNNDKISISKVKKRILVLQINEEKIEVNESIKGINFSSGLQLKFNKKSQKNLILTDIAGKIMLEAETTFKYPVFSL